MPETSSSSPRTQEFQAEIRQLLDILVHSVYTSKDVFIRELVSNAADALEKARFETVRGREIQDPDRELEIRIETRRDEGENVLVIADSGMGMTEEEVRENIGRIAHSGASAFLEKLKESGGKADDLNLIGRFGVGFYSVFMAAAKVVLTTRSADPSARPVVWTSEGEGTYTIEPAEGEVPRGTRIEIHLKDGEERFAEEDTVKEAVRRYSNFVPFPVLVNGERVNRITALWREPPTKVDEEQYTEFFRFITGESSEPLAKLHLSVDAPIQFSALLFVPKTNPEVLGFGETKPSLQLYVRRVLIDGENEDLLPRWLRFARGVVESEDLPLNISRETLQENAMVVKIREVLTRKLLDLFRDIANDRPDDWLEIWNTFGRILKEGHADFQHREKWMEILRFDSSSCEEGKPTGLAGYVERMPGAQKAVYWLAGPSREALQRDARLEVFRKKGIEVLYAHDLADEFVLGSLGKYKDYDIVAADSVKPSDLEGLGPSVEAKEGEEAQEAEEPSAAQPTDEVKGLIERFKEILGERVVDVRPSERLVDSPACLVSEDGAGAHVDRMLRLLNRSQDAPQRILELHPGHPLIRNLAAIAARDPKDDFVERACEQIFEGALLLDGYLADPHRFVERTGKILEDAATLRSSQES